MIDQIGYPQVMALLLMVMVILGVLALAAYAFIPSVRTQPHLVHLGWAGLFLIFLAELIRTWPQH